MIPEPNTDLIRLSQKGDLDAFKNLYRHYEKTIYGYCLRMLDNRQDAEDAFQIIFLNVYRSLSKFRFRASFTTYLMRIARNVCYDILNKRIKMTMDLDEAKDISASIDNEDHDISKAISKLPDRTRECFILFAVEGYPQDQIAKILRIRTGTVKALVFQARQKLRIWLTDERESANELS